MRQLWAVGVAASLLVTGASAMGYLESAQARALDLLLRLRGQRFAPGIVIVAMTEVIFARRGMINDFIGDAVMAIFGAPFADPEQALRAVRSAVAMDQALRALNRRWGGAGLPELRMGIGVHTGEVFAGDVGGAEGVKYTVIGDAVNVAARPEGLNKDLGTTILITEETRTILGERVEAKDRGEMPVRDRSRPLRVYEVLGVKGEPSAVSRQPRLEQGPGRRAGEGPGMSLSAPMRVRRLSADR